MALLQLIIFDILNFFTSVILIQIYIICKLNLAIILYVSVNPNRILHLFSGIEIEAPITRQQFPLVELLMSQKRFRGHFLLIRVFIHQNVCYHV